jgi:hypothetical protein
VLWGEGVLLTEAFTLAAGGVNVTASLAFPGPAALFETMAGAAVAAAADAAGAASAARPPRARVAYYSPPADARAAAAIAAGDFAAFVAAAPAPPPSAPLATVGVSFPAMQFDGTSNYTVTFDGADAIIVQTAVAPPAEEGGLRFSVVNPPGHNMTWSYAASAPLFPSRNGLLAAVYAEVAAESQAPTLSYALALVPWAAGV